MTKKANSVRLALERLGYQAIRPSGANEWKSLDEIGDRYGTTNHTLIQKPDAWEKFGDLTDIESEKKKIAEVQKDHPESDSTGKGSSEILLTLKLLAMKAEAITSTNLRWTA